jgi:Uma2 family endonuclease
MSLAASSPRITEAEYLEIERAAEFKSEFFDGEIFAMAGGTPQHSLIAANLIAEFRTLLKGGHCRACPADLRIKVQATGLFTYPDLSIVCGLLEFAEGTHDTAINPTVLVEVLSDSTEAYNRGKKFEHYRHIPALREYLLVSQREPRIDCFLRQSPGQWLLTEAAGQKATLQLYSLGISLRLAEIFDNVDFLPPQIRPQTSEAESRYRGSQKI